MTESLASALYHGTVVHQRFRPEPHRLRYRVFAMLLDLDEMPALGRQLRLFSHNRFNLFSFLDGDHGAGDGRPLREWVSAVLSEAGIEDADGPVRVLCYPRILGYVFNPLSVFFCHRSDRTLAAVIYEVNNTFGQRHSYVVPVSGDAAGAVRHACPKRFYVSPFIGMEAEYHFRIRPPAERVVVAIDETDGGGRLLFASFAARRRRLDDRNLAAAFLRYPLMTLKVTAGIHWEALRLWRKGIPLVRRPAPPPDPVTVMPLSEPEFRR